MKVRKIHYLYTFSDGSQKFWTVYVYSDTPGPNYGYVLHWGATGTDGQAKAFPGESDKAMHRRKSKRAEGYKFISGDRIGREEVPYRARTFIPTGGPVAPDEKPEPPEKLTTAEQAVRLMAEGDEINAYLCRAHLTVEIDLQRKALEREQRKLRALEVELETVDQVLESMKEALQ